MIIYSLSIFQMIMVEIYNARDMVSHGFNHMHIHMVSSHVPKDVEI